MPGPCSHTNPRRRSHGNHHRPSSASPSWSSLLHDSRVRTKTPTHRRSRLPRSRRSGGIEHSWCRCLCRRGWGSQGYVYSPALASQYCCYHGGSCWRRCWDGEKRTWRRISFCGRVRSGRTFCRLIYIYIYICVCVCINSITMCNHI